VQTDPDQEWLKSARKSLGWTASEMASRIVARANRAGDDLALTQQAVSKFENGGLKTTPRWLRYARDVVANAEQEGSVNQFSDAHLDRIAEMVRGADPDQLKSVVTFLTGSGDDSLGDDIESVARRFDLVPVKSIDQAYGLGATFADDHIEVETRWFPRQWLQSVTSASPSNLTWAPGKGNSMEPAIRDGEPVLIDMTDNRVLDQDLIWAFTIGDTAMMKRLRIRGRNVTILSDNPDVPADHADIDEINIVGRVTHVVRRI